MDKKSIKEYIRALEHISGFLRNLLDEELKAPEAPVDQYSSLVEFTELRMLAKSEAWPEAVPHELLCEDDEDHKLNRAAGIMNDFVNEDLTDKKFLDYGCGEGHAAFLAASLYNCSKAVGFDIKEKWQNFDKLANLSFTSNFDEVKKHAPYDVILINDVIDHTTNAAKLLEYARSLKTPLTGKIYLRCHPFTSRHGTHLYKQMNKAYLHLVFNQEELQVLGLKEETTTPSLDPLTTYRRLIQNAGFTIMKENIVTHPIEMFFTHKTPVLRRIKEKLRKNPNLPLVDGSLFPRDILEIQFVDYILI